MTVVALGLVGLVGCDSDDIDSDEEARRAYFGLDESIGKSLTLGFAGFSAATSANITPQMTTGKLAGTLVVSGQVDQGSSDNKGMRLSIGMVDYTDGPLIVTNEDGTEEELEVDITYDTPADVALQPVLNLKLQNFPNGTFTGTLIGTYLMAGDIEGEATLNLMFSGTTMADGSGSATGVLRVPGNTTVTGSAASGDGTFEVNLKI
jgi:hypothetical protein